MLMPELRYAFDMKTYWSLLNNDDSDQSQTSSEDDTTSLSTARFDDAFGQHGTTAVPKAHRHVEECSLVETLDQVRQYLLGQLEKPPQSHVMSSRRQPRKDYYSRQGDMPDTFQKIHERAIELHFHFEAKPGKLQEIKKANGGHSWGTETEEMYRHSLAIMR